MLDGSIDSCSEKNLKWPFIGRYVLVSETNREELVLLSPCGLQGSFVVQCGNEESTFLISFSSSRIRASISTIVVAKTSLETAFFLPSTMPSDTFYDVLGVNADSQPEDIRKAYKKRALQTHPDRLPQGATAEDKKRAEERFRKVNNAYEILSDPKKRRLYDLYGVWPPPEELPEIKRSDSNDKHYSRSRTRPEHQSTYPFDHPFFRSRPSFHSQPFDFHDPFELFNSFFPEFRNDPFFSEFERDPFGFSSVSSPFNRPSLFDSMFPSTRRPSLVDSLTSHPAIDMFRNFPPDANQQVYSLQSSSRGFGVRGSDGKYKWISESTSTRTVNGVTETIQKKVDKQGNEHIRKIYPDGREKYTINRVEQPTKGYIPNAPPAGQLPSPEDTGYIPPKPYENDNRSRRQKTSRH